MLSRLGLIIPGKIRNDGLGILYTICSLAFVIGVWQVFVQVLMVIVCAHSNLSPASGLLKIKVCKSCFKDGDSTNPYLGITDSNSSEAWICEVCQSTGKHCYNSEHTLEKFVLPGIPALVNCSRYKQAMNITCDSCSCLVDSIFLRTY
jgi:hypothetical protein